MKRGMIYGVLITILLIGVVSAWNVDITNPVNGSYFGSKPTQFDWGFSGIDQSNISNNVDSFYFVNNGNKIYFRAYSDYPDVTIQPNEVQQGWNKLNISIMNITGGQENAIIDFWVDNISPIVNVLNPLGNIGYTNTNTLSLFAELIETNKGGYNGYSAEDGSNRYVARKFTVPNGNEFSGSYIINSSNISDVSQTLSNPGDQEEGNYTYIIKARDKDPNGTTIRINITNGVIIRDTLNPMTTLSNPLDGSLNMGMISISSSAVDDLSVTTDVSGINNIDIQITDGIYLDSTSCIADLCNYDWDSTSANGDGIYTITATAYDRAGNSDLEIITITIDNTKPIGTATLGTPTIYDGDLIQEVTITYDEVMDISTTPTITFTGNIGTESSNGDGTWDITNTIWTETFTIIDANEETLVSVSSSNAQDLVGNVEDVSTPDNFDIDTKNPTGMATLGTPTIYDGDLIQEVTITYDEVMDISTTSTITFGPTTGIITSNLDGSWDMAGNVWTETFTITDANEETLVSVSSSNAQDLVGNVEGPSVAGSFDIDTLAPTVTLITISDLIITESDDGGQLTIDVDYLEAMDQTINPVLTFVNDIEFSGTLAFNSGSWTDADTYRAIYDVTDVDEEEADVDVSINGGQDLAGNSQISYTEFDIIDVDTKNPTGYSVIFDQSSVNIANENAISFTFAGAEVGATYNYAISDGINPDVIGTGIIATPTDQIIGIDVSSLDDGTLTLIVYLTDVAGNQGADAIDTIDKDGTAPTGTITLDTTPIYDGDLEQIVTITYDEVMDISTTPIITFGPTTGIITSNSDGLWGMSGAIWTETFTITDADEETLVSVSSSNAQDLVGNVEGASIQGSFDIDTKNPTGYSVIFDQSSVNIANENAISFTFAGAEVGATYDYSISDGINPDVIGTGIIATPTDQIIGIDVSSLDDGTLTLIVYLTDVAGNQGADAIDTIDKDVIIPIITLLGNPVETIEAFTPYLDDGATANDNYDGDITTNIVTINLVDVNVVGVYIVTYDVADSSGNNAVQVTRIVNVVDTIAPVLTNIASSATSSSATITWTTNENANSTTYYGTTNATTSIQSLGDSVTSHSISLSSLLASTFYYFNVSSCDAAGNCAVSTQYHFTTSAIDNGNGGGGSGGGGGGSGSSSIKYYTCSKWNEWSACSDSKQTRICSEKIITTSQKGVIESKFNATETQTCTASVLTPTGSAVEESESNEVSPVEEATPGFFGRITGAITGAATGLTKSKGGKVSLIVLGILALAWLLLAISRRMNRKDAARRIKIIHKSDLGKK